MICSLCPVFRVKIAAMLSIGALGVNTGGVQTSQTTKRRRKEALQGNNTIYI